MLDTYIIIITVCPRLILQVVMRLFSRVSASWHTALFSITPTRSTKRGGSEKSNCIK